MTGKLLFTIALLSATAFGARETEKHNGLDVAAKQVIVGIDPVRAGSPLANIIQRLIAAADGAEFRTLKSSSGIHLLRSRSISVTALINILRILPGVTFVEPDHLLKSSIAPNDPGFNQQWSLLNFNNPGVDISATSAWTLSTGSTANVVGVVDTGIDYTHPDLAPNVWSAPSAFSVNLSWGTITCPAGSHGYNAIARSCDPRDDSDHGTHVAGTIGAAGNNSLGVTGINWTTKIMGLKFIDNTGSGFTSDAIDAIEFALAAKNIFGANANLRVLSNSYGGDGYSQSFVDEITAANNANVLFVVAAGNSHHNLDTTPDYPSSYTVPNIISVAATTDTDGLASFSNYGRQTVHLGAPGFSILSTIRNSGYGYASGTSMATPHVSGAAMLVLSRCAVNTAGLKNALLANVDPISSLQGVTITGGRLNVNKAIRSCTTVPISGGATFVKSDTTTGGSWKGTYGSQGYTVINDSSSAPAYAAVTPSGNAAHTWAASTSETRATMKGASTDRLAACWFSSSSFGIDVTFSDNNPHQVAVYMLDWDTYASGRRQRVDIEDSNGNILDSRTVTNFTNGQYLVWNLSGHVIIRFLNTNSLGNAVVSGIFFGGASVPVNGTASFIKTDSSTAGSWRGAYGAEGYTVINDSTVSPSYGTLTPSGNSSHIFVPSTTETRALQKGAASDRIAACWFSYSAFTMDVNFTDTNVHQVALYLLDWDGYGGGRTERIDILDTSNNVLDTRFASGFGGGQYLVWNLSGHVVIRVTNTNPSGNALVSGIFFGKGATGGAGGTAAFLKSDTTTGGSWRGVYGVEGYNVIANSATGPSYGAVTPAGNEFHVWSASTSETRATQKAAPATDRLSACWFSAASFNLDVNFTDSNVHQVALYMLDWDLYGGGRTQRIDILDPSNNVLDTRFASGFANGQYLVWNLSGHVIIRITNTNPAGNAVISGIFFGNNSTGGPTGTAAFVKTDTTTLGSWRGVYGTEGFNVIADTASAPSYATVVAAGNEFHVWNASTSETRATQKAAPATDRLAACLFSSAAFTLDVNFTDVNVHQVALYMLDWDAYGGGRTQRVDIVDQNNNVLDSRTVANFGQGQYLVWNLSGHVTIRITNTNPFGNAVMSGMFFR